VDGSELTLLARPASALSLSGTFAYMDARLSHAVAGLNASADQRLPTVPHLTGTLTGDYVLSSGALQPSLGATISYVGERPASFGNPVYRLPDYTSVDLRAAVTLARARIQFYASNVFDERGQLTPRVVGANTTSSTTVPFLISISRPRTVGLTISTEF
jgi:hypothetical protein